MYEVPFKLRQRYDLHYTGDFNFEIKYNFPASFEFVISAILMQALSLLAYDMCLFHKEKYNYLKLLNNGS